MGIIKYSLNFIRKTLSYSKFIYGISASIYHYINNLRMFIYCTAVGIKYYFPIKNKPSQNYKSQYGQDIVLEKLGLLKTNGFFVEIGSNDPIFNSNSYYLEKQYGYSGVSVDPIDYSNGFREKRPRTTFINCVVDDKNEFVEFCGVENHEGWQNQMSSIHKNSLNEGRGFEYKTKIVPAKRLSDICESMSSIDILLLDVEGHELHVLESFDWNGKVKPNVILAENCGTYFPRKMLVNYLKKKGYKIIARIGTSDDIYTYSSISY